jgi:hypothetical protein
MSWEEEGMFSRFGACGIALSLALVLGASTAAFAANPTFTALQTFANGSPMNLNTVDRNYDPRADVNGDGAVDVVDLLVFVQDYWPQ